MLEYAGLYLAYSGAEPRVGWDEAAARVKATVESLVAGRLDENAALLEINEHLRGCVQLIWWGPFEELLAGDGWFSREVRAWWSGGDDATDGEPPLNVPPIDPDRAYEFAEDLWQYGIPMRES
jgi:hypothetical protein